MASWIASSTWSQASPTASAVLNGSPPGRVKPALVMAVSSSVFLLAMVLASGQLAGVAIQLPSARPVARASTMSVIGVILIVPA